jgi:HK97 family phage prohead protease
MVEKAQPNDKKEIRRIPFLNEHFGIRSTTNEDGTEVHTMYGSILYNSLSEVMEDYWGEKFVEEISEGAFDDSIRSGVVKSLWCHDTGKVLGSTKSQTLRIKIQGGQIDFENDLPNNTWGSDARESVQRGDVDGVSFGMVVKEERWSKTEVDGEEIYKRSVLKADFYELSPTGFPAYPANTVNCRSLKDFKEEEKNAEAEYRKRKIALEIDLI